MNIYICVCVYTRVTYIYYIVYIHTSCIYSIYIYIYIYKTGFNFLSPCHKTNVVINHSAPGPRKEEQ